MRPPSRRVARPGDERGFTIIELLVATTVMMIALMGLMTLLSTTARGNRAITESGEAVEIAEETMEELRAMTVASIEAIGGYGSIDSAGWGPVPYHLGDVDGRRGVTYVRTVEAIELGGTDPLVKFRVIVRWAEAGGDVATAPARNVHQVSLEMLRTRQETL